jgi:hypothetical protein
MEKQIKDNVTEIIARIESVCAKGGRDPESVTLLAATKKRSPEVIRQAVMAGVKVVGENRVQEMLAKMPELTEPIEWHFIGHLQRNKVKQVVGLVGLIHSVDSIRLAEEIDRRAGEMGIAQAVLLQVSLAAEESKSGLKPEELEGFLDKAKEFRHMDVRGLSTIAPLVDEPEEVRWVFKGLAEMGRELEGAGVGFRCDDLSMGMTNDYEVAIEEGSTCVRIGNAIFGSEY